MRLDEIMKALYFKKQAYFIDMFGKVKCNQTTLYNDRNNCISENHIERWLLMNDLLNVSVFLNQEWTPDWENEKEQKYILTLKKGKLQPFLVAEPCSFVYFKSEEIALEAINILGEKKIISILRG